MKKTVAILSLTASVSAPAFAMGGAKYLPEPLRTEMTLSEKMQLSITKMSNCMVDAAATRSLEKIQEENGRPADVIAKAAVYTFAGGFKLVFPTLINAVATPDSINALIQENNWMKYEGLPFTEGRTYRAWNVDMDKVDHETLKDACHGEISAYQADVNAYLIYIYNKPN